MESKGGKCLTVGNKSMQWIGFQSNKKKKALNFRFESWSGSKQHALNSHHPAMLYSES